MILQPLGDRDGVHRPPGAQHGADSLENLAVATLIKIFGRHRLSDLLRRLGVDQQGADDGLLRLNRVRRGLDPAAVVCRIRHARAWDQARSTKTITSSSTSGCKCTRTGNSPIRLIGPPARRISE